MITQNPFELINARLDKIQQDMGHIKQQPYTVVTPPNEIMTIEEVAAMLGYTVGTLHTMVSQKRIPCCKPDKCKPFFLRSELINWLANYRVEAKI